MRENSERMIAFIHSTSMGSTIHRSIVKYIARILFMQERKNISSAQRIKEFIKTKVFLTSLVVNHSSIYKRSVSSPNKRRGSAAAGPAGPGRRVLREPGSMWTSPTAAFPRASRRPTTTIRHTLVVYHAITHFEPILSAVLTTQPTRRPTGKFRNLLVQTYQE